MILIISIGEFLLYYCQFFFLYFISKKKKLLQDYFWVALLLLQESIFSGLKILKESSSVQVMWEN